MQNMVHLLGFMLLVSGLAGLIELATLAINVVQQMIVKPPAQTGWVSQGHLPGNYRAAHERVPFVMKP